MGRPDGTGGNGRAGDGLSKKGERGRKKGGETEEQLLGLEESFLGTVLTAY